MVWSFYDKRKLEVTMEINLKEKRGRGRSKNKWIARIVNFTKNLAWIKTWQSPVEVYEGVADKSYSWE